MRTSCVLLSGSISSMTRTKAPGWIGAPRTWAKIGDGLLAAIRQWSRNEATFDTFSASIDWQRGGFVPCARIHGENHVGEKGTDGTQAAEIAAKVAAAASVGRSPRRGAVKTLPTAATLVAVIRERGSDATDLRDAVHEAHHALSSRTVGRWTRENIHRHMCKMRTGEGVVDEVLARIVEQDVCARLGVDPGGDLDKWIGVSCFEATAHQLPFLDYDHAIRAAQIRVGTPDARRAADAVIALATTTKRSRR